MISSANDVADNAPPGLAKPHGSPAAAAPLAHPVKPIFSEDRWDNEGGSIGTDTTINGAPSRQQPKFDAGASDVSRMARELRMDYAAGRVGLNHNTYEHRSRLVRQATEREAMRRK
ncbi:hypothetical protein GCM10023219_29950 [Stakelama sediminis]